jgi:hypothetical protein
MEVDVSLSFSLRQPNGPRDAQVGAVVKHSIFRI